MTVQSKRFYCVEMIFILLWSLDVKPTRNFIKKHLKSSSEEDVYEAIGHTQVSIYAWKVTEYNTFILNSFFMVIMDTSVTLSFFFF